MLLEFESHQTQAVNDIPFHAHLVEATSVTSVEDSVRGGRPPSGARRRDFRSQLQCQDYGCYGHLVQCCYYRFNRDYGDLSVLTMARVSPVHADHN